MVNSAATHPLLDVLPATGNHPMATLARPEEDLYGGFTRFELELEFVQALANPYYLNHLASQNWLQDSSFIKYLKYLQYFNKPEYIKYLSYPGPTLKALELLQQEKFRQDILGPDVVARLAEETVLASIRNR
ncbi:MAG: hypothetical protein L6R37_003592 [Teloschistes peruensis]|nr:MAG: hypothetical protein L6R37_003592 [Teloschistes peruensis]